jgi:hypothetical protein
MYQKLQVGRALSVVKSDTIEIPNPAVESISSAATGTTSNKLVDSAGDFENKNIEVGDIVYNTTDSTVATVSAIDSATVLSISADIMASGETYRIFRPDANQGCVLYVGGAGNIKVETVGGDEVVFSGVLAGSFIPVQVVKLFSTSTTATNVVALW